MTEPATASRCPVCGEPLPADAPGADGVVACPRCLLRAGIGTGGRPADAAGAPSVDEVARKLPQFEVLEVLGRGGMGVVWKARQRTLDRIVALKVLPADVAATPGFAERFRREAKALARLDHPNIVRVHDCGEADGLFWLAMEHVDGTNLRQAMAAGAIRPREALAIVRQICDALEYLHGHGVVHRDVKPENVLIDRDGRVKVADFGIAKIAGAARDTSLTLAGQVIGTVPYMAPEQIEHPTEVDHRADIYSLGVVFYELLTGELPLGRFAAPSKKVQVDIRLDEVVLRTLEKEREARYQRAVELRTDVDAIGEGAAAPRRWPPRARETAGAVFRSMQRPGVFAVSIVGGLWAAGALIGDALGHSTSEQNVRTEFLWTTLALLAGTVTAFALWVRAVRDRAPRLDSWLAAGAGIVAVSAIAYGLLDLERRVHVARTVDAYLRQRGEEERAGARQTAALLEQGRELLRRLQIVHGTASFDELLNFYAPDDRALIRALPEDVRARRGADGVLGLPLVSEERLGRPLAEFRLAVQRTGWPRATSTFQLDGPSAIVSDPHQIGGAIAMPGTTVHVGLKTVDDVVYFTAEPLALPRR